MRPPSFSNHAPALTTLRAGALIAGCLVPSVAHGYTISSAATTGCHETITSEALRTERLELATAAPLPADRNERALIKDLEFVPDSDMNDLGGVTLLVSVRDNDLKGRDSSDVTQLALVHGEPKNQREHCLRNANEKEPGGSEAALLDCRAFIRERIEQASRGSTPRVPLIPASARSFRFIWRCASP